ncbi:hypothetical protein [Aurantibacillus circumpalustris]|uniref:hypothetical protein n=1 Tax=Aurantibacillus circumpalustris TaxID=3036359 RepID=UPI00295B1703|nr:hypothetical protein [Aurantibacillus circumpalustris]
METVITSYCSIKNNSVSVNGKTFFEGQKSNDLAAFMSSLYKQIELNYPKFFKMDKLCKLGTLAAELVIRDKPDFNAFPKNEIALVISNNASSLESDRTHASAIADKQNYFPSPSVFVYTLPNIVIGEIAIKHKITGENAFFVSDKFDAELMYSYCDLLLKNANVSTVLGGWVNVDEQSAEAFVYCVKNLNFKQENEAFLKLHSSENLQHLFSL